MMKYILSAFAILISVSIWGQPIWTNYNSQRGNYSFKMPSQPSYYDTLRSALYHLEMTNSQILEVHYVDSARINYSLGDPYELYAQSLIYSTNGTLESVQWVTQSTITGKEIGISYTDHIDNAGNLRFVFVRVFFWNDQVLSFSISGYQSDLSSLLQSKIVFFNSISFN